MTKAKSAEEIKARLEAARAIRRQRLLKLIDAYGSPYKAALGHNITPSAFYARMEAVGLERQKICVKGEPETNAERKVWWQKLLKKHGTVKAVAEAADCSVWTVEERFKKYRIAVRRGVEPEGLRTRHQKTRWLKGLLLTHGNAVKVAEVLGCTASAIYERMGRYGLKTTASA